MYMGYLCGVDIIIIIATDATYYCTLYIVDFIVITQHT